MEGNPLSFFLSVGTLELWKIYFKQLEIKAIDTR